MSRDGGARTGPYEVTREPGRGAVGLVLAAVQPSTRREVALTFRR